MSRRPALVTEADVARALRAAQKVGPEWCVEIVGSLIRLTRSPTPGLSNAPFAEPEAEPQSEEALWNI